jgi:hypothetical protein
MRGSSFRDDPASLPDLTVRRTVNDPAFSETPGMFHASDLGFRTASDTDPELGN